MPEQNITIRFKPLGDKKLIKAINDLNNATKRLQKLNGDLVSSTKQVNKNTGLLNTRNKRLTNTNKDLGLSFATLRSKMLLFNFAMALGIRQVFEFGKQAASVNLMKQSFLLYCCFRSGWGPARAQHPESTKIRHSNYIFPE